MSDRLKGKLAVVAGASRGCGRGIALALGEQGATVYVTGRSIRGGPPPVDGISVAIEDTADEVTRRGGVGIPVQVNHCDAIQVVGRLHGCRPARLLARGPRGRPAHGYAASGLIAAISEPMMEPGELSGNSQWRGLPLLLRAKASVTPGAAGVLRRRRAGIPVERRVRGRKAV